MGEKARVFISCGQRKDADYLRTITAETGQLTTPELTVAKQISEKLKKLGYEPYIALEQQTLQGVKEAIFKKLENVEYFLFVDFRREGLFKEGEINFESGDYRGSLFSNQELAIATFQGYEVLAFQEEGVKKQDGILKFIQANCRTFSDRKNLVKDVVAEVKKKWNPNWRNEIEIDQEIAFVDSNTTAGLGRFYHIKIKNRHKDKTSRNCVAFVARIKNLRTGKTIVPESVELKWKGVIPSSVHIMPKSFRYLDALHIMHTNPSVAVLGLNPFTVDYSGYTDYRISELGDHEIDYVILSENFSPAVARFRLHLGTNLDDAIFQKV
jgi:hypothetical protein